MAYEPQIYLLNNYSKSYEISLTVHNKGGKEETSISRVIHTRKSKIKIELVNGLLRLGQVIPT
jgi:hypothetical protein